MQPFEVVFMAFVVFGVMVVAALASGSKGAAAFFFVLAVVAWGAYLGMAPA
jgi:hypothetical protein